MSEIIGNQERAVVKRENEEGKKARVTAGKRHLEGYWFTKSERCSHWVQSTQVQWHGIISLI